jgi:hypothetical protein
MDSDKNQLLLNEELPAPPAYDESCHPVNNKDESSPPLVTTTIVTPNERSFDRNKPLYRTCCCHVAVGSIVFAALDLGMSAFSIIFLVSALVNLRNGNNGGSYDYTAPYLSMTHPAMLGLGCVLGLAFLQFLTSWLLLMGIKRTRPGLLVPDMVLKGFYVGGVAFMAVFCVAMLAFNADLVDYVRQVTSDQIDNDDVIYMDPETREEVFAQMKALGNLVWGAGLVHNLLMLVFYGYYFSVVRRTYAYLTEKRRAFFTPEQSYLTVYKLPPAVGIGSEELKKPPPPY